MYEIHTTQEGTGTHSGDTFDLDYSLMQGFKISNGPSLQIGAAGYLQRQVTAKTGPAITPEQSAERYAVNAIGFASTLTLAKPKLNLGVRFFDEFANRATFQGYSVQFFSSLSF